MEQNLFKILNVYADCSARELAASKARITAFTSVGIGVKDLVASMNEFEDTVRTVPGIQTAYNALQQPSNKVKYAISWFFKPEDDDLRDLLENTGDMLSITDAFENYYDKLDGNAVKPLWLLQDLMILNMRCGSITQCLKYAYEIFQYSQEWLSLISCETLHFSKHNMEVLFISQLNESGCEISPEQLCVYRIEQALNELGGTTMPLNELDEIIRYIENLYSEAWKYSDRSQLNIWSDRIVQESMRIIKENFPFRTKIFAQTFFCKASDEVAGKAKYAATQLEQIYKLFDCSEKMEKITEKEIKKLRAFDPPLVIAAPLALICALIFVAGLFAWFPVRCLLWVLFSLFDVKEVLGKMEDFMVKCCFNGAAVLVLSSPVWVTCLLLLEIISFKALLLALVWMTIYSIEVIYEGKKNQKKWTNIQ